VTLEVSSEADGHKETASAVLRISIIKPKTSLPFLINAGYCFAPQIISSISGSFS